MEHDPNESDGAFFTFSPFRPECLYGENELQLGAQRKRTGEQPLPWDAWQHLTPKEPHRPPRSLLHCILPIWDSHPLFPLMFHFIFFHPTFSLSANPIGSISKTHPESDQFPPFPLFLLCPLTWIPGKPSQRFPPSSSLHHLFVTQKSEQAI